MNDTVECPVCFDFMPIADDGSDQDTQCPDCRRWFRMTYDAEFRECGHWHGGWIAKELDPPSAREVEGDLRYHSRN